MSGYGERLVSDTEPPPALSDDLLLAAFAAARVPSSPYAYSVDPTGETTLGLIEADPFRTTEPRAVLSDREWVALQEICDQ